MKAFMKMVPTVVFLLSTAYAQSEPRKPIEVMYPDGSLKMSWFPEFSSDQTGESLARAYLVEHAGSVGLENPEDHLKLLRTSTSLLGTHYTFQQFENGDDVFGSEIVISIDKTNRNIYLVYNNLATHSGMISVHLRLTKEQAFDIAWKDLQVKGELFAAPKAQSKWFPTKVGLVKGYEVILGTTQPLGSWTYFIHGETGAILSKSNRLTINHKSGLPSPSNGFFESLPMKMRSQAFADFYKKSLVRPSRGEPIVRRDATAWVFNPNPVVALKNAALVDDSPAEDLEGAYVRQPLKGVAFNGTTYTLDGEWVRIIEWNAPETQPSSSQTGRWEAKRGENAFNDAMTYFHVDASQRYIQSLGFNQTAGIIHRPIEVDTDGFDGGDNSFYDPSTRRLVFGHGCVDDNEDADVIMHEYGHALEHDMVPNWDGGDSGAIGEGFGDYWATSYRLGLGQTFELNKVFAWDSAGGCWPGRRTDLLDARYDVTQEYFAHGQGDGFVHDELWSTPLTQALMRLTKLGVPRSEVDTVVLQSHFGLSSGVTMRDMAIATVATASLLYGGPHARVLSNKFRHHEILDSVLEADLLSSLDLPSP